MKAFKALIFAFRDYLLANAETITQWKGTEDAATFFETNAGKGATSGGAKPIEKALPQAKPGVGGAKPAVVKKEPKKY
jgi:hypothetical protein